MKVNELLSEIQAEIVKGVIPGKRVFDSQGKIVPFDQLKGSESQKLLGEIKAALKREGILNKFDLDDMSTIDIKTGPKNTYILTTDYGDSYTYNIVNKRITAN
ncbi:hypothetical protein CL621_01510 [archaeon]|nr:hypothetical protein [archaeon]|tara:strand:- start:230 stop:538 length:309 start_codon:yes stop_codon:yes gene_type:complete